jgi:hypothetical protein
MLVKRENFPIGGKFLAACNPHGFPFVAHTPVFGEGKAEIGISD